MNRVVAVVLWGLLPVTAFAQRPNRRLTPGQVRTTSRTEICDPAFHARRYRHTHQALKLRVCKAYGVEHCPDGGRIEIDHLIPLELGGADTVRNLWPEFAKYADGGPGFHVKDRLENELHRKVCNGEMPLPAAQKCIAKNWIQCYQKVLHKKP